MSMPIWILLLAEAVVLMKCAPKLGNVHFDPLSYEAEKFEQVESLLKEFMHATHQQKSKSTIQKETSIQPVTETFKTTPSLQITSESTTQNTILFEENYSSNNPKQLLDIFKVLENAWSDFRRRETPLEFLRTDDITETDPREPCAEYEYNGKLCKIINNRLLCGYNKNKGELKQDKDVNMGNGCRLRNERLECGYEQGPWNPRRPPARDEAPNKDETFPSKPVNISVPKLRTDKRNISSETISVTATPKLVITAETTTTEVITEATPELMTTTRTTTYSKPKLTSTEKTTEFIPEIAITQQTFTLKLESSSAIKTTKDPMTNSKSPGITKVVNVSPVQLVRKLRRSVSENKKPTAQSERADEKPKRYCVEKGDRIVCYYTKNF